MEGLGNLLKHYSSRFFRYLDPYSSELQPSTVVTFCLEINFQNCIRLTHRHVLSNMCPSTRAFLFCYVLAGPIVDSTVSIQYAGDKKECVQSSVTVCWKSPRKVSFPLIRWPQRHPDEPTKYRLTLSIISNHSIIMTQPLMRRCVQAYLYTQFALIGNEYWCFQGKTFGIEI